MGRQKRLLAILVEAERYGETYRRDAMYDDWSDQQIAEAAFDRWALQNRSWLDAHVVMIDEMRAEILPKGDGTRGKWVVYYDGLNSDDPAAASPNLRRAIEQAWLMWDDCRSSDADKTS